jgi:hypothetical protein
MVLDRASVDQSKARIFISYSRNDIAFADRLEVGLKERAFAPLIDRTEIHAFEDWWKHIQALIVRSDTIVFVLSPDSVSSDVCRKGVAFAAALNKRFAPIVCRRVDEPTDVRRLFSIPPGPSVLAGRHAGCPKECTIETRLRGELAAEGNIAQGSLTVSKHHFRALQPLLAYVPVRCNAHSHAEHTGEVGRTETSDASQLCNRNISVEILRDVVQHAMQPDFVKPMRSMSLRATASRFSVRMRKTRRERECRSFHKHAAGRAFRSQLRQDRATDLTDHVVLDI